jgi:hypothetical protein
MFVVEDGNKENWLREYCPNVDYVRLELCYEGGNAPISQGPKVYRIDLEES